MREITDHRVNIANDTLAITVIDQPGAGGANHRYDITGFGTSNNPSATDPDGFKSTFSRTILIFQNGAIGEVGVNGITHEALIAILIDRLRAFQSGPYHSQYNQEALEGLETAKKALHRRTLERMQRGVEGTHTV